MDQRDSEKIIQLAREGKKISSIWEQYFPKLDYWEVYSTVVGAGEKSSVGAKRMISNRLHKLAKAGVAERAALIEEIDELVWHLYDRYKESQKKLEQIRSVLDK